MNREEPIPADVSIRKLFASAVSPWFTRRRGVLMLSVIVIAAGLYFNWAWLVAAGIAPVLVAVSPCLAMCALGVCHRVWTSGESCDDQTPDTKAVDKHAENQLRKTDPMLAQYDDIARRG